MSSGYFHMVFELLGKARGGARLHHLLVHAFHRLFHRLGRREESIGEFIPCRHLRLGDLEIGLERRDTISGMGQLLAHHRHHLHHAGHVAAHHVAALHHVLVLHFASHHGGSLGGCRERRECDCGRDGKTGQRT
jgi:hypothetical protein